MTSYDSIFTELLCLCTDLPTELVVLIFKKIRRRKVGNLRTTESDWICAKSFYDSASLASFDSALDFDSDGNIFLLGGDHITWFSPELERMGSFPVTGGGYNLVVDYDGTILVNATEPRVGNNVSRFSKDGVLLDKFETSYNEFPGISVGQDGIIYLTAMADKYLAKYSKDGDYLGKISLRISPYLFVKEQNSGNFIVADMKGSIYIISPIGIVTSVFPEIVQQPKCITLDGNNVIVVSGKEKIVFLDPKNGKVLNSVQRKADAVGVNSKGNLIVVDNRTVMICSPL